MSIPLRTNYPTREIGRQIDYEALKRHAFEDQGIVVVRLDDPRLTWDQREMVKQVGAKLYGQRRV
jgi:hypothetical protein